MKKIDIFIVKIFLRSFFSTFFIAFLILLLQAFWLFLEELAGKGLGIIDILKFSSYIGALAVGNALPISILAGSIMSYGALAEKSEIVAMQSFGISMRRIAQPVAIVAVILGLVSFAFQNFIIPTANLKLVSMRYDIISAKPAFALQEGVFYTDLEGFVILVDKKQTDDKHIEDIIIYQTSADVQDHLTTAQKGIMYQPPQKAGRLRFILDKGHAYQKNETKPTQFITFSFDKYIKDFSLWQFESKQSDSLFYYSATTQNIGSLVVFMDDLHKNKQENYEDIMNTYYDFFPLAKRLLSSDTNRKKPLNAATNALVAADTVYKKRLHSSDNIRNAAMGFSNVIASTDYAKQNLFLAEKRLRDAIIEINKKFIMSFICIIFFLLGSSLGVLTKRGSIGLPLALATAIFVAFFFSNTFVEKWSRGLDGPNPYLSPWINLTIFLIFGLVVFFKMSGIKILFKKK